MHRGDSWAALYQHLESSMWADWADIATSDWPRVKADIESSSLSDDDPIPVPKIDLGTTAAAKPKGPVTTSLAWGNISDGEFEELLFHIIEGFPSYQNPQLLMRTNAPDRGRDVSAERVIRDDGGTTRTERLIIQAKHLLTASVSPVDVDNSLASLSIWEPPIIRGLIIATSGRFTADAVAKIEQHNERGERPYIEMWPDIRIGSLLSQRPDLLANYRLSK